VTVSLEKAPTRISASGVLADAAGPAVPPQLRAKLTSSVTGSGLAGKLIEFWTQGVKVCEARTDDDGVASCLVPEALVRAVIDGGYEARFTGDDSYLSSAARASLI
jgi:hypothetical protein